MSFTLEPKRADEERTYWHNWAPFLGADIISSQTTTADGATVEDSDIEPGAQEVRFKITGGLNGTQAVITQKIVTAFGDEETELFILPIQEEEPLSLAEAKSYLRVIANDEDGKIEAMIPRARKWVEDACGLSLVRRQIEESRLPKGGAIELFKRPLVSVDNVAYVDSVGAAQGYVPRSFPPSARLLAAAGGAWPLPRAGEEFAITYTAGFAVGEIDERLKGAICALIEGEFSDGYAYPEYATQGAERCLAALREIAP